MKKVFLDSNVILDAVLKREGYEPSAQIIQFGTNWEIKNCTSVLSFANIAYILRKQILNKDALKKTLTTLFDSMSILPMGDQQIYESFKIWGPDFEDTLQMVCADHGCCDAIVTRDKKHFKDAPMPVYTPYEFFSLLTE